VLAGALWLSFGRGDRRLIARAPSEDDLPAPPPRAASPASPRLAPTPAASGAERGEGRALREVRLARAERTLADYLSSTRYPPTSRPLREQPDMERPNQVATRRLPLARKDKKLTDATVTLRQDRFYLMGDDRALLSVSCANSDGPVRCEIDTATAAVPPGERGADRWPKGPVTFVEEAGGFIAQLAPAAQGFAGYHGPIRVDLSLRVGGESGGASFDVMYTPAAPAVFTGHVREAMEAGSLALYVELSVEAPGRYVIDGRVDAGDKPLAIVSFNEELSAGKQEARLVVFGALARDEGAEGVFHLHDLTGFRLLPDTYPDRETMPDLTGEVYASRPHRAAEFSSSEWASDEKQRHVDEMTKDVTAAKVELAKH
jgi:hypothetical protein